MGNDVIYSSTLRIYNEQDKKLLLDLKKEFGCTSVNKCILQAIRRYHQYKKELEKIRNSLRKNVKVKYELPEGVINDIIED